MAFRTNKMPVLQTKSASGSVATFNTALAMPLASCNIAVNAWQEGSGDPSPSNVRPIHGFSVVNATANEVIHTIQLGQEVYGAEVDVVNGVAHVTHGYREFDGSDDENWVRYVDTIYFIAVNGKKFGYDGISFTNEFENVPKTFNRPTDYGKYSDHSAYTNTYFTVPDASITTVEAWRAWLASNPIQYCYELATPFDIQLTPTQIETLIGNNTIFADTGDTSLTFKDLDIAKRGNFREVFKLPS